MVGALLGLVYAWTQRPDSNFCAVTAGMQVCTTAYVQQLTLWAYIASCAVGAMIGLVVAVALVRISGRVSASAI